MISHHRCGICRKRKSWRSVACDQCVKRHGERKAKALIRKSKKTPQ